MSREEDLDEYNPEWLLIVQMVHRAIIYWITNAALLFFCRVIFCDMCTVTAAATTILITLQIYFKINF